MAHYVDGFVVPVPVRNLDAYRRMALQAGRRWMEHGALRYSGDARATTCAAWQGHVVSAKRTAQGRRDLIIAWKSAGGSRSNTMRAAVRGCTKPSVRACSMGRGASIIVPDVVADVDALADQRMIELGKVYSNLVLTSGLEPTLDQRSTGKLGNRFDVRHRAFRFGRRMAFRPSKVAVRAAHSVAAIQHEMRIDARRGDGSMHDGVVDALDVMRTELCREHAFRLRRSREHHESARVLVEAMHDADLRIEAATAQASQHGSRVVGKRVLVARLVGNAQHSRGLVDHDDVAVEIYDGALGQRPASELGCAFIDDDDRVWRDAKGGIETALSVNADASVDA